MKKSRIVVILLSLLLIFSCSTEKPVTADLTLRNASDVAVAYSIRVMEKIKEGEIPAKSSVVETGLPVGDASISYKSLLGETKVTVAKLGNDKEVTLELAETAPTKVYIAQPSSARALGASTSFEYSFFIFNEDGSGFKTTLKVSADAAMPVPDTVAIGWKLDGSVMLIAEDGHAPIKFTVSGDALVSGSVRWEKAPEGEKSDVKTIDGVWNLLAVKPLAPGYPSPARVQLAIENNGQKVALLASVDAAGIPSDDISSKVRSDVEMDLSDSLIVKGILNSRIRYSSNGGLAVIRIDDARIPLIRGKADSRIRIWDGTTPAPEKIVSLDKVLAFMDSTPVKIDGKDVYIKNLLAKADTVVSTKGTAVDVSGVWTVGSDTWTTNYAVSVSDKGAVVFHVPDVNGFHVFALVEKNGKPSLEYKGVYLVSLDGDNIEYSGTAVGNAVKTDKVEKSVSEVFDTLIKKLLKSDEVSAAMFKIGIKDGAFKIIVPNPTAPATPFELKLVDVTVKDNEIGFKLNVNLAEIMKKINGIEVPGKLPGIKLPETLPTFTMDVVFPYEGNQIVLGQIGDKVIAF